MPRSRMTLQNGTRQKGVSHFIFCYVKICALLCFAILPIVILINVILHSVILLRIILHSVILLKIILQSVILLRIFLHIVIQMSTILQCHSTEHHISEFQSAECHSVQHHFAECRSIGCHRVEGRGTAILYFYYIRKKL